jgi:hypothetical protein
MISTSSPKRSRNDLNLLAINPGNLAHSRKSWFIVLGFHARHHLGLPSSTLLILLKLAFEVLPSLTSPGIKLINHSSPSPAKWWLSLLPKAGFHSN